MGVRVYLYQVSSSMLEKLKATPKLSDFILCYVDSRSEAELMEEAQNLLPPEVFERIKAELPTIVAESKTASSTDVDKAWAGLSSLLAGDSEPFDHRFVVNENPEDEDNDWGDNLPLVNALWGSKPIGEPDLSYLTSNEVKQVAQTLLKISTESLKKRFYSSGLMDCPPYGLDGNEGDWDYLEGWYSHLVEFYQDAAEKGNAMLIDIN